eukprot:240238-Pyramimonas_sp.AAC.1
MGVGGARQQGGAAAAGRGVGGGGAGRGAEAAAEIGAGEGGGTQAPDHRICCQSAAPEVPTPTPG